jgi:tRNA(fMet)-specific endonuclease VapC
MILDTNALSAWWKSEPEILAVLRGLVRICVPVPALAEFRFGVLQSTKRELMEMWMSKALSSTRILAIDEETTQAYASLRWELKRAGKPLPMNDLWIAAIARQHRLPILSRDSHFDVIKSIERNSW